MMSFARVAVLLAIAAPFFADPSTYAAPGDEPDRVALRIEVYGFAGFHVLTNRTTVDVSAGRYAIAMDLDTRGIASVLIDLSSHSEARGRLIGDAVVPEAYRSEVRRNGVDRQYRIDYRADGPAASRWAPPAAGWESPIPPAELRGTVDQLSAYFIIERRLAQTGSCRLSVPVFDGHDRYNLRFTDAEPETLTALGPHDFAGRAYVCGVTRQDIAGYPGDQDQSEGTYRKGKVWYARLVPGSQMVPVRMEFDTEYGVVTGYLAELHGRGVNLRFIE